MCVSMSPALDSFDEPPPPPPPPPPPERLPPWSNPVIVALALVTLTELVALVS